jgi:hypothetical protein
MMALWSFFATKCKAPGALIHAPSEVIPASRSVLAQFRLSSTASAHPGAYSSNHSGKELPNDVIRK